jgi:hypothetical protein
VVYSHEKCQFWGNFELEEEVFLYSEDFQKLVTESKNHTSLVFLLLSEEEGACLFSSPKA